MINLWDGYTITADEYQYILGKPIIREHKVRGKNETRMEDATYHGTLAQALAAFHRMQLREMCQDYLNYAGAGHRGFCADRRAHTWHNQGAVILNGS